MLWQSYASECWFTSYRDVADHLVLLAIFLYIYKISWFLFDFIFAKGAYTSSSSCL